MDETAIIASIRERYDEFPKNVKLAANFVLDNIYDVGLLTVREISSRSGLDMSSFIRLSRALGYSGYKEFRSQFQEVLRSNAKSISRRATSLQRLSQQSRDDDILRETLRFYRHNIESTFHNLDVNTLSKGCRDIVKAKRAYVFGTGASYCLAHYFWYLSHMGFPHVTLVPAPGSIPIDDLSFITKGDMLILFAFHPYRQDMNLIAKQAKDAGAQLMVITDKNSSPLSQFADHIFIAPSDSMQFFTSLITSIAAVEIIVSFMISTSGRDVLASIERFHDLRSNAGIYL